MFRKGKMAAAAARVAPESLSPCEGLAFGREEEEIGRNLDLLLSSSTSKGRLSGTRLAAAAASFLCHFLLLIDVFSR